MCDIVNVHTLHVKCRISREFLITLDFLYGFSFNLQIPNFMKICSVGTELFHADG